MFVLYGLGFGVLGVGFVFVVVLLVAFVCGFVFCCLVFWFWVIGLLGVCFVCWS